MEINKTEGTSRREYHKSLSPAYSDGKKSKM
jgi:hypothetical protein